MNAKWKVITSVMLLIMTICAVFIGLLMQNCRVNLERHISEQVKSAQAIAQIIESQKSGQYRKRIKSLINARNSPSRQALVQAFANQDRDSLLQLSIPFFEILKKESIYFSTFGWVLPDNHAFLRIHDPEKFGKNVSKMRPDIVAANREGRQFAGFTAGYVGLQYRIVQPVTYKNQHIGTIQFGLQDSFLLDPIQEKLQIPVGIALPNEAFKYIKKSKLLNLPGKSYTIQARDISIFTGKEGDFDWSQKQQHMVLQGKEYVIVKVLDLNNFAGQVQGHLFVALDISEGIAKQRALLLGSFFLSSVILFLSFLILNTSYGRLVQKIVNLNTSLERNNRELEDRVRDRTQKLYQEIEDRKIAEKERARAEAKAQRSSKMEALGLMAGGVAHDLNNILSGIVSYPELMLLKLPEDSDLRKMAKAIQDSGKRAALIVSDLLTVARGVAGDNHITNLNSLVQEYFDSPEWEKMRSYYPQVRYTQDYDPNLFNISCSSVHVKKCLMNLINNGLEAIDGDGEIKVSTRNQYVDKPLAQNQYMAKGEYVVLTVTDSGAGIAEKDMEHIFEPFYTKKKMGRSGTGLGLAIVWNTVNDHGGAVTLESSGEGTCFTLYFPSVREDVTVVADKNDLADLQGNGESVLVVDDEEQQREIATQMFNVLGYHADSVSSGEKALEYVKEKKVDLLLLDMIMDPGINGQQTYEQISEVHPGQKAIIASGFSETEDVKTAQSLGAGLFIRKPYTLSQLGMAVKQVLGKK
jgi:signal transduction histidine kinase